MLPLMLLLIVAVLVLCLWLYSGFTFLRYAFRRKEKIPEVMMPKQGDTLEEKNRFNMISGNRRKFTEKVNGWLPEQDTEELVIESSDHLKLHGLLVRPAVKSHDYVILCHGYMGTREWMMPHAYVYGQWGWNSLVLDMRSHGKSEGKWMGMGWKDKDDVRLWIDRIIEIDPEARIVLQGISMGGATVMMTSGLDLPSNVKAVIADCGYTSVWKVFSETMEITHHIKAWPVLSAADFLNVIINHWSMRKASSTDMLAKASPDLPILFVQGADDTFVLPHMLEENYEAKRGLKEKKVFSDTDHGNSSVRWPKEYFGTMKEFLDRYVE